MDKTERCSKIYQEAVAGASIEGGGHAGAISILIKYIVDLEARVKALEAR